MNGKITVRAFYVLIIMSVTCWAGGCVEKLPATTQKPVEINSVEAVLKQLGQQTEKLKTYKCRIEYLFSQPLFESQTLRKGELYYERQGKDSKLRINLQILKQDDEKEQKHIEQYIFDGQWLTQIDYELKEVKHRQIAEANDPNGPIDVFELLSNNFPIIGFTNIEELKNDFEIQLIEPQNDGNKFIQMHLKVKPDSVYKDDYVSFDFWIDKKLYLPARIIANSVEEEIYEIKLLGARANKKLDKNVFKIKIPKGFNTEIIRLNQEGRR